MAKKGFASSQRNGGDKVGKCRWGRRLCWRRVEWQVALGEVAYGDHATIASSHVCTQAGRGTRLLNVGWLTGGP
jgi:hypothetical protein